MSEIKRFDPEFSEDGQFLPKQKFCASCKKRMQCDKLYNQHKQNHTSNDYSEIVLDMYYTCDDHEAMYIEFPILVNGITSDLAYDRDNNEQRVGDMCIVSVNADGYDEDLHLGIYLGMLPISIVSLYDRKNTQITNKFNPNPAIFVPKFKKIFYGMNMRWQFLENEYQLQGLADNEPKEYLEMSKNYTKNS